ncbi:MAG TPA: AAA family ATPase, partial [Edaphobacter sp.]|uniref:AAA family ATPase n=1 Tax=Edaphobacter sp. TaxID=1934404 RepID=UPI002BAC2AE8
MKIAKVLLRWYKSFNINYLGYADRHANTVRRPWNGLGVDESMAQDFPFIEIPIERDITTIVGGNESGKSHLLSAISKVLTGKGILDDRDYSRSFSRTDLCHFAALRNKNADLWPNIGLQFGDIDESQYREILRASGVEGKSHFKYAPDVALTLVLAPDNSDTEAYLFVSTSTEPVRLTIDQLAGVRRYLPTLKFIKSDLAIADQVTLAELSSGYGLEQDEFFGLPLYDFDAGQQAAALVEKLSPDTHGTFTLSEQMIQLLTSVKESLHKQSDGSQNTGRLEALLFRDVLGIEAKTIKLLAGLDRRDRGYIEGLIALWNQEVESTLNLAHYWQQDEAFSLKVNYKQGTFFFEISDKTGSIYTFRERSSGLRYFLSYYIQAKALEGIRAERGSIILMDEPDSFLSIIGQRNLLSVFESLVGAETSRGTTQLIYTTHSPFLVNRNFPHRIRLVRKGDAEEGSQFVDQARVRRYEPIRSALGIDCAQTLFMGATNLLLEGPTDQYLLSELIRFFVTPDTVSDYLDLNSVVLVSAESAPAIGPLLQASQWSDEPIPATVVLLDGDQGGREVRDQIIGKGRKQKKLINEDSVLLITDLCSHGSETHRVVTTEDILPVELYRRAVIKYVCDWHPEVRKKRQQDLERLVNAENFAQQGLVAGAREVFAQILGLPNQEYDKFGVLQKLIEILYGPEPEELQAVVDETRERVRAICQALRRKIELSQQAVKLETGTQALHRIIGGFLVQHKNSSSVTEMEILLERIEREAAALGDDADPLKTTVARRLTEVRKMKSERQNRVINDQWKYWEDALEAMRRNPL